MTYGALTEVAALVPRYATPDGTFDAGSNPPAARITTWLTQVSAMLDAKLSARGYSTPVTETNLNATLDLFTNDIVAVMVEGTRGTGRYAPKSKAIASRGSWYAVVNDDIEAFLDSLVAGDDISATSTAVTRSDGWSE